MKNTQSSAAWLLLALCVAILGAGLLILFKARFDRGDVYPPYSSLRTDPLGTMALFESLNRLQNVRATRDFVAANRLPEGKATTYLHAAASISQWQRLPDEAEREIERFLADGGRLIIALHPRSAAGSWSELWEESRTNLVRRSTRDDPVPFMSGRWGLTFDLDALDQLADGSYEPVTVRNRSALDLPGTLEWHSGLVCRTASEWNTIYSRDDHPVVVERRFGRGSVVVATDSYFLSNEAMLLDREPAFLSWLVGPSRTVVFDEAHLGVSESPGIAAMMRRYRLHGFMAGLALLAALFLWKNICTLVPRQARAEGLEEAVTGKDAAAGFVNLLRRSIPPNQLLATCHDEWMAMVASEKSLSPARVQRAEAIFQAHQAGGGRDPIETYRKIAETLKTGEVTRPSGDRKNSRS